MNPSLRAPVLVLTGIGIGFCMGAAWNILNTSALPVAKEIDSGSRTSSGINVSDPKKGTSSPVKIQVSEEAFENGVRAVAEYPTELLTRINKIAATGERLEFIRGVFTALARDYPEYALELAKELTEPREKSIALRALAIEWAFTESIDSGEGLKTALVGVAFALSASNPQKATMLANSELDGRERDYALSASASRWAEIDPAGAAEWASELQNERNSNFVSMRVASAAAEQDPAVAATLISNLKDSRARGWAVSQLASKWFERDPDAAVSWTWTLSDPGDQQRAVGSIAQNFARNNPAAAMEWASSIRSAELQKSATSKAIAQWAETEPASAANYALTSIPAGDLQRKAVEQVAREWGRSDRVAATAWIQQIPDESLRTAAIQSMNPPGQPSGSRIGAPGETVPRP
jgi:hypothetical protein